MNASYTMNAGDMPWIFIDRNLMALDQVLKTIEFPLPGEWGFTLLRQGGTYGFLAIDLRQPDSMEPEIERRIGHRFPVPPVERPREWWEQWVLERIVDVLRHEACEHFIVSGERPFYPHHNNGRNPYAIERTADVNRTG